MCVCVCLCWCLCSQAGNCSSVFKIDRAPRVGVCVCFPQGVLHSNRQHIFFKYLFLTHTVCCDLSARCVHVSISICVCVCVCQCTSVCGPFDLFFWCTFIISCITTNMETLAVPVYMIKILTVCLIAASVQCQPSPKSFLCLSLEQKQISSQLCSSNDDLVCCEQVVV